MRLLLLLLVSIIIHYYYRQVTRKPIAISSTRGKWYELNNNRSGQVVVSGDAPLDVVERGLV